MAPFWFLHVDDVHIGRERIEGTLPSSDFAKAFNLAVDVAIHRKSPSCSSPATSLTRPALSPPSCRRPGRP